MIDLVGFVFDFKYIIIGLIVIFAAINGFHDGCNVIATVITTRSLKPKHALIIACLAEFIGAIAFGTAVALTIGFGVLSSDMYQLSSLQLYKFIFSAVFSAMFWNIFTWFMGIPSSSSHALIGGIIGAAVVSNGFLSVKWVNVLDMVLIPLLLAPMLGFVVGFIIIKINILLLRNRKPSVNIFLKKIQVVTMAFLAASHGSNDAQKSMGLIVLVLWAESHIQPKGVPIWVILFCALAISVGLSFGGWRIIKTVSRQVSKMQPLHSFNSQIASGLIIYISSIVGFPVSTTQTVGSSIMGTGAGYKLTSVRWLVIRDILTSWLITIPSTALLAVIFYFIILLF